MIPDVNGLLEGVRFVTRLSGAVYLLVLGYYFHRFGTP